MGWLGRGRFRNHVRIVAGLTVGIASGCSLVVGLDDHQGLDPASEGGIDGNTNPDGGGGGDTGTGDTDGGGGKPDAPPSGCATGSGFGTPEQVTFANGAGNPNSLRGIAGKQTVYVTSDNVPGAKAGSHVFTASRAGTTGAFSGPTPLNGNVNSTDDQRNAMATDDEFQLFYIQGDGGPLGNIWYAKRDAATDFATTGYILGLPQDHLYQDVYEIHRGSYIYVVSKKGGSLDIYESERSGSTYGALAAIAGIDTQDDEFAPVVNEDATILYFARRGADLRAQIYGATGHSDFTTFSGAVATCNLYGAGESAYPTWLSSDGKTLYYVRYTGSGPRTLWQVATPGG